MFVTNHGNFGRDLTDMFHQDAGTFFPYTSVEAIQDGSNVRYANYASGLWIGGKVDGQTRIAIAEYSDEYVPGSMADGTFSPDKPSYKVYKLYRDSLAANPNADYDNWPVEDGAPVVDDGFGNMVPDMIGDQMLWAVYNDADPDQHTNNAGETEPLGLELRQTTFAFDRQGALGNIIFIKLQVFNKGGNTINDCYLSLWADPDLGGAGDDYVGCDTLLGVGYVYNAAADDAVYGLDVPCMGYDFFQGPMFDSPGDTARMWGQLWPDMKNLGMVSFNKYINGTDPNSADETYNYMQGLSPNGDPYVFLGDTLLYMHSGDPTTIPPTGDIDVLPADRRFMLSTGPITFRPGDSTEIIAAIIIGQRTDYLESINKMKELDAFAQLVYENNFNPPNPPATPNVTVGELSGMITFSWDDTSEVDPGDFVFEGYTVWQGETETGPWRELKTWDLINGVDGALIDTIEDPYSHLLIPDIKRALSDNGLVYRYVAEGDVIRGGPLNDITTYFYRVTAFSFATWYVDQKSGDTIQVPIGDRFLESSKLLKVVPHGDIGGAFARVEGTDTLPVTHVGSSDGSVIPIVMDQAALTNHTYSVVFEENLALTLGYEWHLIDVTAVPPDTLIMSGENQSGDDAYFTVDGIFVQVNGPALEGTDWDYVSADPANLSPVATTDDPEYTGGRWITGEGSGELMFGGIYLAPNFQGTTLGVTEYRDVELHWRPMASYTDLTGDGAYNVGEPYVVDDPAETQSAFMYGSWASATYSGFHSIPFTAWDVSDAASPRQLNVVVRDRDQNDQWDMHNVADPADPLLPNNGDQAWNYIWVLNTDYDATGTMYGDGTGGTIGFMDDGGPNWMSDAMWAFWLGDRGNGGTLAEEGTLSAVAPVVNSDADSFTFVGTPVHATVAGAELDNIRVVPNPFYLYGGYDPGVGAPSIMFHGLPADCNISIYNLAGEFVVRINEDEIDQARGTASWNALTRTGLPVASGIYLYVVDGKAFGQKIGKFAVFTEVEVLKRY